MNPIPTGHVVSRSIATLKPYEHNARTHSKRQIQQIANSITSFGFNNPVLVDQHLRIVAGHGRVRAAQLLGLTEVPTIELAHLTPDQIKAYMLADNRLAELAGWDKSTLKIELQNLISIEELAFEITDTGFEIGDIDILLQEQDDDSENAFEEPDEEPSVTQLGDIWRLGCHRILCGSCLEERSYATLMEGRRADVVFTDPPYNVKIDGNAANIGGKSKTRQREFGMASGEMSGSEFQRFLTSALQLLAQNSQPGAVHFVCMDWRHIGELIAAGNAVYQQLLNVCVWAKDRGGMGSFYRSQHELVFVFKSGGATHQNNIQLGRFGRSRTNIWQYPCARTISATGEEDLLTLHPTVKPLGLVADAILDCSSPKDLVVDAFLGAGTTLLAAQRTRRVCYGIELDPKYVDTAIRRWERMTKQTAIHAATGQGFEERKIQQLEMEDENV